MTRRRHPITVASLAEAPPRQASLCFGCARLEGRNPDGTARCEAFDAIPASIWSGRMDHRGSLDGDRGLSFVPLGDYGRNIETSFVAALSAAQAATETIDTPPTNRPATAPNKVAESLPLAPPEQWHAVIGVEGVPSGDRRLVERGALTWLDMPPPMPLSDQAEQAPMHDGAVHVGQATRVERMGDSIHAWGYYLDTPEGAAYQRKLESAGSLHTSWEIDDADIEIDWPDGAEEDLFAEPDLVRITRARLTGMTSVVSPAFSECYIEPLNLNTESNVVLAAAAELAARIPTVPPHEWFQNPHLTEPTPLTITDDGRVYGHLAVWGTCHVGFQGTCITAPYEASLDYFLTGEIETDDGARVPVGQLTFGTGHADTGIEGQRATIAHYDNTGTSAADLTGGPDAHGIWIAGALRPGLTPERIREVRAAAVSGDWRRIKGEFRLVAALAVNVPGFPVPRTRAHVASGVQVSLVAAGIVHPAARRDPLDKVAELLAGRIGRDRRTIVAAMSQRVHDPELTTAGCNCGKRRQPAGRTAAGPNDRPGRVSYEVVHPDGTRTPETTLIGAMKESRRVGGRYKVVQG